MGTYKVSNVFDMCVRRASFNGFRKLSVQSIHHLVCYSVYHIWYLSYWNLVDESAAGLDWIDRPRGGSLVGHNRKLILLLWKLGIRADLLSVCYCLYYYSCSCTFHYQIRQSNLGAFNPWKTDAANQKISAMIYTTIASGWF